MSLPKNWEEKELGEICDIFGGSTPSRKNERYWSNGNTPWLTHEDISGLEITKTKQKVTEKALLECNLPLIPKNSVILSCTASIGKVCITRIELTTNQQFNSFVCDKSILPEFLAYSLIYRKPEIENMGGKSTFRFINKKTISKLRIAIPPILVQKQIVSILERAEKLKEKRKQANALTAQLGQSVFLEMFGNIKTNDKKWTSMLVEDLFDMKLGKMLSAKNYTGKHLKPYLRNVNVLWGKLDLTDVKQMDFDDEEFKKYELKKGDILVCEGGEVGRTATYTGEIKNCGYQNALHRLRIKKPLITSEYFICYMKFASQYGLIAKNSSKVTIAHFTAEKFKKFSLLLPPISLQKKFSDSYSSLEKIKQFGIDSNSQISLLFDSLMQKAFNGELVS